MSRLIEQTGVLFGAFRTTESGPDGYRMVFKFPTMGAMHAADDEWHALRQRVSGLDAAIANLRGLQPALNVMARDILDDIIADLEGRTLSGGKK